MKTITHQSNETMHHEFSRLGDSRNAILRSTPRPVTPFGGLIVLIEFWRALRLPDALRSLMPFEYHSPNSIGPVNILLAFWLSVTAGARRFSHANLLRADLALRALLGWSRWPSDDAIRSFFARFKWRQVDAFFPPLTRWLLDRVPARHTALDLDSTVFERYGKQEGAKKGYNPRRPGRLSHHPLLAVLAEPLLVLHGWLRSGDTAAGRGVMAFVDEALALLPAGWVITRVRADSGFCSGEFFDYMEGRSLPYIVVARMSGTIKACCAGVREWRRLDGNYEAGEFRAALMGWKKERRFVVIRERVREEKPALGRKLIDVPGYTYRVFVTDGTQAPELEWRDYNQRACIEQRIGELKDDLAADDFCKQEFYATEAAFRAVLMLFNLLSTWQKAARGEEHGYQRPATLRMEVFMCGAIAGSRGHTPVVYLSMSWGGVEKRKPMIDQAIRWCDANAPRLGLEAGSPRDRPPDFDEKPARRPAPT